MAYLTYEDYQSMGGTLTNAAFSRFEFSAERHIDRLTHGRIVGEEPAREAVKKLMYEMIAYLATIDDVARSGVKSMSNKGMSASYVSAAERRAHITELAIDYLSDETTNDDYETPLLYAGVDDI